MLSWKAELLIFIFILLFIGGIFYAIMVEIGNFINFSGLFIKLYQQIKKLFHLIKLKIVSPKVKK